MSTLVDKTVDIGQRKTLWDACSCKNNRWSNHWTTIFWRQGECAKHLKFLQDYRISVLTNLLQITFQPISASAHCWIGCGVLCNGQQNHQIWIHYTFLWGHMKAKGYCNANREKGESAPNINLIDLNNHSSITRHTLPFYKNLGVISVRKV